jgi:hypothetical protein
MARIHIGVLAVAAVFAACSTVSSDGVSFELGAAEFHGGDQIVVEDVLSTTGGFSPGSVVTVRGSYCLASRDAGTLYLGTTFQGNLGDRPAEPRGQVAVHRGTGRFELQHRVPAPGHLHVTFYDPESGRPFAGQYFGRGESLLISKEWAYAR